MAARHFRWLVSMFALAVGATLAGVIFIVWMFPPTLLTDKNPFDEIAQITLNIITPFAVIFCVPIAWVLGYPMHVALYRAGRRGVIDYCLAAIVATVLGGSLILGFTITNGDWVQALIFLAGAKVGAGTIGGLVTWLIRRPDLDKSAITAP